MKKFFLTGAILLSIFSAQSAYADIAPDPTPILTPFTDVASNSQYYDALLYLKNEGVIDGYPDGSFKPNITINRAEFTKIIIGAMSEFENRSICADSLDTIWGQPFTDVPPMGAEGAPWYMPYICFAKSENLISGYPDGSFKPNNAINFAEAAKIIANAFDFFSDSPAASTEPWYKDYVVVLGSVNAIPTTIKTFNQKITRGEMAEMAYRLMTENTSLSTKTYADLK